VNPSTSYPITLVSFATAGVNGCPRPLKNVPLAEVGSAKLKYNISMPKTLDGQFRPFLMKN